MNRSGIAISAILLAMVGGSSPATGNDGAATSPVWSTCNEGSGVCLSMSCEANGSLYYRVSGMDLARDELSLTATFSDEDHVLSPRIGGYDAVVWTPFEPNWIEALKRENTVLLEKPGMRVELDLKGSARSISELESVCERKRPPPPQPAVLCGTPVAKKTCG